MIGKFDAYETDLRELKPVVRQKAIEIAEQLQTQGGYETSEAIQKAIKQAEAWFLESEG